MDRAEIGNKIREFLVSSYPNEHVELTDTTNLLDEWFVDSMEVIQIVLFIETTFDVELYRADITGANFKDIATIASFVAERLSA